MITFAVASTCTKVEICQMTKKVIGLLGLAVTGR